MVQDHLVFNNLHKYVKVLDKDFQWHKYNK
jgi:hypothetical protein